MTPQQAYRHVRTALQTGELTRPSRCERCGSEPSTASDGRSRIHAHHHEGYDKPLSVQWLCAGCHRAETPLPAKPGRPVYGANNGQSRLTDDDARAIRTSKNGCIKLSRQYGVDKKTIQRIRNGTHWRHVT